MPNAFRAATPRGGLLVATLLAGCTGTDGKDGEESCVPDTGTSLAEVCACEPPGVRIGGGDDVYEDVEEGAAATMIHGPQGGWHVLGSARIAAMADMVTIHYTIEVPALGATVSDNTYRVVTCGTADC